MNLHVTVALATRLYEQSRAARWGLSPGQFQAALEASAVHAFAGRMPAPAEVERYAGSLHLEDLALAAACAAGLAPAWDTFVLEYRPALRRAADGIDPSGGARELADSLLADLFGLEERGGVRQSLFRYFHGRSNLATWLRAVLAQRVVDRVRSARRFEPLSEDEPTASQANPSSSDPDRPRLVGLMRRVLAAALNALTPRDRLRLALYYAQGLTLALIGGQIGEHEATVSRQLARTRRTIRESVEQQLRQDHGLNAGAVAQCWQAVLDDAGPLDVLAMVGGGPTRKNAGPDRSET